MKISDHYVSADVVESGYYLLRKDDSHRLLYYNTEAKDRWIDPNDLVLRLTARWGFDILKRIEPENLINFYKAIL